MKPRPRWKAILATTIMTATMSPHRYSPSQTMSTIPSHVVQTPPLRNTIPSSPAFLFTTSAQPLTTLTTHTNPAPNDESDEEHLPFWPERAPPTPTLTDPNQPADLNDAQIIQWTRSQMPWHLWRQQQIPLGRIPDSQHGPPVIHREMPNRNHMRISDFPSADTLDSTHRMLGYLRSNLPWSTYLDTLPAIARRYYHNMPPNLSDVHIEITQPPEQPPTAYRSNLSSLGGPTTLQL